MRIIGGSYKGRKIKTPRGAITRPTSDRVREALFNILRDDIYNSIFLDIFAGSGAVGLEALSRGAKFVTFIEKDITAYKVLKQNIKDLALQDKTSLLYDDFRHAINELGEDQKHYDIVFLDPPYNKNLITPCLNLLLKSTIIDANTIIVLQTSRKEPIELKGFTQIKQKKYGKTLLTFIIRSEDIEYRNISRQF